MKKITTLLLLLFVCLDVINAQQKELTLQSVERGKIRQEIIQLDFLDKEGNLNLDYVQSVKFSRLDSISFKDRDPDAMQIYKDSSFVLNYIQEIQLYSPEYYCLLTAYYNNIAMQTYNQLFKGKINFNSQEDCLNLSVVVGDIAELTSPHSFIFRDGLSPSKSLFYHEVGHRAFWYLEKGLGIKFKGLSLIHMGLLEYLTMSFNDSPLVGENFLPAKGGFRNGENPYSYQHTDSLNVKSLLDIIKVSYPKEMNNPQSSYYRFVKVYDESFGEEKLEKITDNHRGAMILASTLWRIREQIGADMTNELVAETILNLNQYMAKRSSFMKTTEGLNPDKIEWCDVYYGLLQKDHQLNQGKGQQIITNEFKRTEYPIDNLLIL